MNNFLRKLSSYFQRVLRRAFVLDFLLLKAQNDISAVFKSQELNVFETWALYVVIKHRTSPFHSCEIKLQMACMPTIKI